MSTILLGYRGAGKTTIGKRLADRLWQKFVDTDDLVVKVTGKTIKQIFEEHGESMFRELEVEAVKKALTLEEHVIALGGGAVLSDVARNLLRGSTHKRLYLKCEPQELLRRLQADPNTAKNRPDLTDLNGGIEEIELLLNDREPLYRQVMTGELDVTNVTPEEAVVRLVRLC
jgi:shikimate kinase